MARFLHTLWPIDTHIYPNIAVAHALHERGHEVAFYTGEVARSLVEGEGFRCFPFQQVDEAHALQLVAAIHSPQIRLLRLKTLMREFLLDAVPSQLADLEVVLAAWPPDAVVCGPAMWGPILVLHETQPFPVAVLSHVAACLIPGPEGPILGASMPRPENLAMKLLAQLRKTVIRLATMDIPRGASAIRKAHGLPPLDVPVAEFTGRLPLYLMPGVPQFDYERDDLPPSVHYVGPCLWEKPGDRPPPEWLEEVRRDQPWVLVTEGLFQTEDMALLQAATRGLTDLPLHVMIATGDHPYPAELQPGALAPNLRPEPRAFPIEVLPFTSVVATTGKSASVMGALSAGVPLVVVPMNDEEQNMNAWRVEAAGAGLRLPPERCTPAHISEAVEHVLSEPSFRANAQRMAAAIEPYGGPARAAELLEKLVGVT